MNTNPTIYITRDDEAQAEKYDSTEKSSILEKDHPLLEKFQKTLKEHLLRVQAQLIEEIADLDHTIKVQDEEREDIGSKLYDMQQKIDEQRDSMDEFNKQIAELSDKRRKHEVNSKILRKDFYEKSTNHKDAKRLHNERLQEITNLQILESSMARWTKEVKDEVTLAKRVVSKDGKDRTVVTEEKRKMDLFIQNMDAEVRRRQIELNNINEQIVEQRDSIETLNRSLSDANADLEELQHEHKRLLQAWGEVIVSIQHRDKMLAKAKSELQ
jgi:coiled-coil domain-containing protein 40